ncbi:hypothetical protein TrispH2_006937 [Trichoplax sp. H2]|nr:hypothetical protein TrispH2_006937 [Trichoplax sp. H2]|eukprot:RDD41286.1 hypothetical protein TrispH2_006937 [Trichoplax sp. H2]
MEENNNFDTFNSTLRLPKPLREVSTVFLLGCLVFGIFGNGIIIISTLSKYKIFTVTKMQMLSLSISDLAYVIT